MGFFDALKSVGQGLLKEAEKVQTRNNNGSAIGPGRMRQTDVVRGSNSPLPSEPGMYRHVNKETGTVDYVGQTNNIRKRQQQHELSGKLNTDTHKVQYAVAKSSDDRDALCNTEVTHIARHKPTGNKTKGGNGRR